MCKALGSILNTTKKFSHVWKCLYKDWHKKPMGFRCHAYWHTTQDIMGGVSFSGKSIDFGISSPVCWPFIVHWALTQLVKGSLKWDRVHWVFLSKIGLPGIKTTACIQNLPHFPYDCPFRMAVPSQCRILSLIILLAMQNESRKDEELGQK